MFAEVEGIPGLSCFLSFTVIFVPGKEKAHSFFLLQENADLWRRRDYVRGWSGRSRYRGEKKKNEGELQPWENNDKGWSEQREREDRGRSAVTNESFSSPQQNKKMKGIVTGQPCLHVGELWWTLSASFWMTEVTFIYRKVRNQINISSSHLTVNFQTRYSRRFWGRFPTT